MSAEIQQPDTEASHLSSESETETPDISVASSVSTCTTFSDLGDTSVVSRKEKNAALKWSKKAKKKSKAIEKKKLKNKISKDDFCAKSLEFKAWLRDSKGLSYEVMDLKKQKYYFKKFIKKWNGKKLDKKYYRGIDCLWAHGTPNTQVSWAMPGNVEMTPGSLHEGQLEEKYSRQRDLSQRDLGTFGKAAGVQMLRELRSLENIEANNEKPALPKKPSRGLLFSRGASSSDMSKWPAPPSPLGDSQQTCPEANTSVEDMLPPPPLPAKPETSCHQTTVIDSATSSAPETGKETAASRRPSNVVVMRRKSRAVPAPPPRIRSMYADPTKLGTSSSDTSETSQDKETPRQRPLSYAGETLSASTAEPQSSFKVPVPPTLKPTQSTASQPQESVVKPADYLVVKSVSHDSIALKTAKSGCAESMPEAKVCKTLSLDSLCPSSSRASTRGADTDRNSQGPPNTKYPRPTVTAHIPSAHGDSAGCHDNKQTTDADVSYSGACGDVKRKSPMKVSEKPNTVASKLSNLGDVTAVSTKSSSSRKIWRRL